MVRSICEPLGRGITIKLLRLGGARSENSAFYLLFDLELARLLLIA